MKKLVIFGILISLLVASVFVYNLDAMGECICYCDDFVIMRCGEICAARCSFCTMFMFDDSSCASTGIDCYQTWEAGCETGPDFSISCSVPCEDCEQGSGNVFWQ